MMSVIDLQTHMDIVYSYSTRERYHIHPDKSKCITFGMKFPPSVKLNDKASLKNILVADFPAVWVLKPPYGRMEFFFFI